MFNIKDAIQTEFPQVVEWYQHLHQYPEPSFQEFETTEFIKARLTEMGGYTISQITPTGLIAEIKGAQPGNTIALRADIDCLRMQELGDFEFASKKEGFMHGCGHDAHTVMLLGVAAILSKYQDQLQGTYRLLFQPGEEEFPGGAIEYIKGSALEGVDYILGQHVMPTIPTGQIGVRDGAMMAASDRFTAKIQGSGGHASQPHLAVDPVAIGAEVVANLQHIVSREIDPLDQLVVSVTQFHAGSSAVNVIPGTAELGGSVRSFSEHARSYAAKRIEEIIKSIAATHRATAEVNYVYGYDATINNAEVAKTIREIIETEFGANALPTIEPLMGAEDFSRYLRVVPGCFFFLGMRNEEKGFVHPIHHGCFRVDINALPIGMEVMLRGAVKLAAK
ncbi:MAG: amidohydrolase [Veillonella sp.]|uniref:M20 metallopeptidase family protein n=1 Tax=Veillonella sp. TaxID=1926307 RepID=UPI0025F171AA|nr:amidohydrolase [Veillonella sp.]MBS4912537.1 amidohydrolase [Veillonella sp.]